MHIRFYLLIFFCFAITPLVSAQEFTLKGVISRKVTTERVGAVDVKDLQTRIRITSDQAGWFAIKTKVGDTLLFVKEGFTPQKLVVLNNSDMVVYLQPIIKLDEVRISGQTKRQEINGVLDDYRRQGTFYNGKPPVLSFLANPVTGIYELFGKTPNRARRFANNARSELEYTEVKRRYNVDFVKEYTKLSTDSLAQKFMNYYTPSYEDMKNWNDYELIKHTLQSYELYKKDKNRDRFEQFANPTFFKRDSTLKLSEQE